MSFIEDKILQLSKQLYPTGRAFKMYEQSTFEKLHLGLAVSESQTYNDAAAILNSILPDNNLFDINDAIDWERRLGLVSNDTVSLADRKLAIRRKLTQPGVAPAKSNWRYLEQQLRLAGFDVYVYENRFYDYPNGYYTQTPFELTGNTTFFKGNQHGDFQHGQIQHGGRFTKFCANHIDETTDWSFIIAPNLRSTFYIGGANSGDFANVLTTRKDEFRQLILTIKPTQTVAFLLINYT